MNQSESRNIQRRLLFEPSQYQVIRNESQKGPLWWRAFGFPAKIDDKGEFQRIEGFISCLKCKNTQIHNKSSGTKRYKEHADKCYPIINETVISSSSSSSSSSSIDLTSSSSSIDLTSSSSSITISSSPSSDVSIQPTLHQMGFIKSTKVSEKDVKKVKDSS
ncbi:unnamed protein product, partial [Rotaria magnacalcarata]